MDQNRKIARFVTVASFAGVLALAPARAAFAQQAVVGDPAPAPEHGRHGGIEAVALGLDSLTPAQRTAIEELAHTRRAAEVPVEQADALVLSALARQVEQASIDKKALAPTVSARESAALAARAVDLESTQKLHDLLTPAQRNQLADDIEARFHGRKNGDEPRGAMGGQDRRREIAKQLGLTDSQKAQILANMRAERQATPEVPPPGHWTGGKAWIESFRADVFHSGESAPNQRERMERRVDRMETLLAAAVPVLSPTQRAQLASRLRARAAHKSHA